MGRFFMMPAGDLDIKVDTAGLNGILQFCGDSKSNPGFHVTFTDDELPYTVAPAGNTYFITLGSKGLEELAKNKLNDYRVPPESKDTALRNLTVVTTNYVLAYATCFGLISSGSTEGQYDYKKAVEEAQRKADEYVRRMLEGKVEPVMSVSKSVNPNI